MLEQFAETLEEYQEGVLNCGAPISTGSLEGTNTKIQAMKRQAYGFRDSAFSNSKSQGLTRHNTRLSGEP